MAETTDLIAAIYDSIIEPSRWDEVVRRIVEDTGSFSGNLVLQHPDAGSFTALYNVDPLIADAYAQTYHKSDPLRTPAWSIAPGEVRACTYTQSDSFKASAYYDEFVRPQGWAGLVVMGLARAANGFALLALTRSADALWPDPAEWRRLKMLAPHLVRAAAVHTLLARTRTTTEHLGAAVTAAGFAIFVLSSDCQILFVNSKAEGLLRRQMGLRYERGRLVAATPELTRRLQTIARAGSRPGWAEDDPGGSLELYRGEHVPPLLAHIIPLGQSRTASIFDFDRPAVAVFVVDPAADFSAQTRRFAARFKLTSAESRVLEEVIGGSGLVVAAADLKISEKTARTHLTHIFEKTTTTRQTELIRRFFDNALPGSPGKA
jgi:DNA-binding CsgD family transcriptional regulator